ncbi:MAG TPA: 50S ribosomal protein L18 [Candidatus Altiarchaeales archaeon]|nr:50S ribosomal protein L18 [Candidatus Altiarchaeales archaeon]
MAKKATYVVQFRRKREKKTNYKKRLNLLKSEKTRLVVRRSNRYINVQLVEYNEDGDLVIASANSRDLKKFGWKFHTRNTPAAYLTGLICGHRGISKGIRGAILDIGLNPSVKSSRIYAALKGAIDSGLKIPHNEEMLPSDDRISGIHISEYRNIEIDKEFKKVKNKIIKSFEGKKYKNGAKKD